MIEFLRTAVSRYSSLSFKANQGEDRIMKGGIKGSLWIKRRYDGFRLQTTGEVAAILDREIERMQGNHTGEHKGYKFWYVDDFSKVEEIIDIYGRA
ncbi:MAG: hypothetical protein H0U87_10445 [Acidobacteria bacterium]|jgi:hypothetical protein|nr:hypothetical protein [Acidobacteriota bacterium]